MSKLLSHYSKKSTGKLFSRFAAAVACIVILTSAKPASASAIIVVDVIDSTSISLLLSGSLDGPAPASGLGVLYIDTTVSSAITSGSNSITGNALIGLLPIHSVFSGYNNPPYGGSLQLRSSLNGVTPFAAGDILSGSVVVTFNTAHGMTQGMFDGAGAPIYWGRTTLQGSGTLQGSAQTVATVPDPASSALLALLPAGLIAIVRRLQTRSRRVARSDG